MRTVARSRGRLVARAAYGGVRPAGWTDAATAGVLRTGASILGTLSSYEQGAQQLAALESALASQQAALAAQQAASASRAEGFTLTQQLQAQLAREQQQARIDQTAREITTLRAQLQVMVSASAATPATPATGTAGTSSRAVWLLALLGVAAVGGVVVLARRRKRRR